MRRTYLQACTALVALGLAGCADNLQSVAITEMCAPTDTCAFTEKCEQGWMGDPDAGGGGAVGIDYNVTKSLLMPVQIDNQMASNANVDTGQLDTHGAYIQWEELAFDLPGATVGSVTRLMNEYVASSSSTVVMLDVIPAPQATGADPALDALHAALDALVTNTRLTVRVKLHGQYGDSHGFTTGEFVIPVTFFADGTHYLCSAGAAACPQLGQSQSCN